MAIYALKNGDLSALIASAGAELKSLKDCRARQEYMWNADPEFWKRTSPILFPLVGNYKNKNIRHNGHVYSLPQHGFARDMEFELVSLAKEEIWFGLSSSPETLRKFPFLFRLEIGYRLDERSLRVTWRVVNRGKETMYFSIGGHPAFVCPLKKEDRQSDYYIFFDAQGEVTSRMIGSSGLATDTVLAYPLEDGFLKIREDLFDNDALVIENNQAHKVSLCTPDKKPYVTMTFDAPLLGIWSVPRKSAPFVCIEPWYGRCDHENFNGTLQEREWGNALEASGTFETSYTIEI